MSRQTGDSGADGAAGRRGILWPALAGLAASYLLVRASARQVERDHPPAGKFVVLDGVRLHYVERGRGPVLVLLHGNGTTAEDFSLSGLIGQLAPDFRVIAFDRPGFGYSTRPRRRIWTPPAQARLLREALHMLGVEQAVVLGHSWGAMVALALGLAFPAFTRGLVLLSGYYYPSLRLDVALASGPAIPVLGDLMRFTVSPLIGRLLWPGAVRRAFGPRPVARAFRRLPPWMVLRPSALRAAAAEAALMIPAAAMLSRRYRELTMPVVIMAGADDRVASAEHNALRLHRELAQSELRLLPRAGHMLQYLAQDEIAATLARLAGAGSGAAGPAAAQAAAAPGPGRAPLLH